MKTVVKIDNQEILLEKKGKNVVMRFIDYKEKMNNNISVQLTNRDELLHLIQSLEKYATRPIEKEDKAYIEEFSIYRNEVERSLFLGSVLSLSCYTDVDYDDNWIELPPVKLSSFIGHLYGHLKKAV